MVVKAAILSLAALSNIYTDYPAFVKRGGPVEAWTDKGPIVEMIVRCPHGTGIMSYSKLERRYCSSKMDCFGTLQAAVNRTCN